MVVWALLAPVLIVAVVWSMRSAVVAGSEPPADRSGVTRPLGQPAESAEEVAP